LRRGATRLGFCLRVCLQRFERKIQLPFGIYNELRNVGTVVPFYRIPVNVYGDKTYTNATLDGASLFHRFNAGSDWTVEATAYPGGWNTIETQGATAPSTHPESGHRSRISVRPSRQ
jgi:hypothetical protein